jgi:hypothetical protein
MGTYRSSLRHVRHGCRQLGQAACQQAAGMSTRQVRHSTHSRKSSHSEIARFHGIIAKTMRSKRLQYVADAMCQMFCGWRLIGSKPNMVQLGSGTLEIDAITGRCLFQGKTIAQLTIAEEIRAWLQQDLAKNRIPIPALTGAHLAVKLSFSVVPWNELTKEIFYSDGKAVRTEKMNRCIMDCDSNVTMDKAVYHSKLKEVQEWPVGWPVDTSPTPSHPI